MLEQESCQAVEFVYVFRFLETSFLFSALLFGQETELQPLSVPRIRLRTTWFGENTYCWNSIIQFVKVIRKLFYDFYSKEEEPFMYFSDGSVEMSFDDVLHRPVMEVLGTTDEGDNDDVHVIGFEEWKSYVVHKRINCGNGYFHEDEPSMWGLEFLQPLLEYVLFSFVFRAFLFLFLFS